jgi:hypothetical protein
LQMTIHPSMPRPPFRLKRLEFRKGKASVLHDFR